MDEAVAQFTGITGASPHRAEQYLRLTDGNLEQAVQLYFDSDGVDLEGQDPPTGPTTLQPTMASAGIPARTQRVGSAGFADESGVVHLDSDEEISDDNDPEITGYQPGAAQQAARAGAQVQPAVPLPASRSTDDDEAMARRMQEEMYAGGDMGGVLHADGVRAPMARTTETLVGPGANYGEGPDDMRAAIAEQMLARQRRNIGRYNYFRDMKGTHPGFFCICAEIFQVGLEYSTSEQRPPLYGMTTPQTLRLAARIWLKPLPVHPKPRQSRTYWLKCTDHRSRS